MHLSLLPLATLIPLVLTSPTPLPPVLDHNSSTQQYHSLTTQAGAPWNSGRISHKKPRIGNYVYDAGACQGMTVYVVDTGIRVTHVEFSGGVNGGQRARLGANFVNANPPTDDHEHGTHCAGTAVGSTVGLCHQGEVVAAKAVNDALSNPNITKKAVISISIEGGFSPTLNAAVTAAIAAGIPVSVAAGNNGFSNFGKKISVWAPGVNVLSALNTCDGCYYWYSGTTTPHVAALVAYLMVLDSLTTPSKILNEIRSIATSRVIVGALGGASNKLAYNGNGA
ncbi:subtilisin-like protein [Acephala macrosclerotiorum]|nr:subtilisin-like protein [Acephala macrosclerotiorum]